MDLNKELNNKLHPSSSETGLYNPVADAGVHVRDDGCVEIYAGSTSILVDGSSNTVTINGETINNISKKMNTRCEPDSFGVGNGTLNPEWLPTDMEFMAADTSEALELLLAGRSPLTYQTPAGSAYPLITGAPAQGQMTVTLGSLLKPKPMFNVKKGAMKLLSQVEDLVKEYE